MVRRGHESNILTTPTVYGIHVPEDVEACVAYMDKYFHNPNYYSVGCSMGASAVISCSALGAV
jgi:predicted alpha/beta-fold hydrolase